MGLPDSPSAVREWVDAVRTQWRAAGFLVAGFALGVVSGVVVVNYEWLGVDKTTIWGSRVAWVAIMVAGLAFSIIAYGRKIIDSTRDEAARKHGVDREVGQRVAAAVASSMRDARATLEREDGGTAQPKVETCVWRTPTTIDCVVKNYSTKPIVVSAVTIDLRHGETEIYPGLPLHPSGRRLPVTLGPGEDILLLTASPPANNADTAFIAGQVTQHSVTWVPWGVTRPIGPPPASTVGLPASVP